MMKRCVLRSVVATLVCGGACLMSSAGAAWAQEGPSAWWNVTTGSRPTALKTGLGQASVQRITTSSEVAFILMVEEKLSN